MAERIVLLGWAGEALELAPLDADVLVKDKICRVSFTLWGGPLADAVVLVPHRKALGVSWENAGQEDFAKVMERVKRLCATARPFTVRSPVPIAH